MINDLLAMLGQAWPRLLLYPGGVCALVVLWLWLALHKQQALLRNTSQSAWLHCVPPLLLISLLPLRGAVELGQSLDLFVALCLAEWPLFRALASQTSLNERSLGQILQGYSLLIPSLLLLADLNNSFLLGAQTASPIVWKWDELGLRWLAVLGWLLALFPLCKLGPFQDKRSLGLAEQLRILAHLALISLPLLALLHDYVWLMPLVPIGLGLAVYAGERWLRSPGFWLIAIKLVRGALWLGLAWLACQALLERAL